MSLPSKAKIKKLLKEYKLYPGVCDDLESTIRAVYYEPFNLITLRILL